MLRTIPRVLAAIGVAAVAATTAACGGADKTQACDNIEQEFQNLVQATSQHIDDPEAMANSVRQSAEKIREEGEPVGGDVEAATEEAATALTRLAERVADGTIQQTDLDPLVTAGTKIRQACDAPE